MGKLGEGLFFGDDLSVAVFFNRGVAKTLRKETVGALLLNEV
ncbi:MAG: hypothetical protein ACJASQ_001395 [Crocinitomicaceae bacterium]|jgi:hypothetical protein